MKRKDFTPCIVCGKGIANNNQLAFNQVSVNNYVLNIKEISKEHGRELMFGGGKRGAVLASVMGPDPDLTIKMKECSGQALVCLRCASDTTISELSNLITEKNDA